MKRFAFIAVLPLALVLALPAQAADPVDISSLAKADGRYNRIGHGGVVTLGKARADTVYILGGPDRLDGKFQDASGAPDWQGWTHLDLTAPTAVNWNCSDYHCQNLDPETVPNHAWWCGTYFDDDCGSGDFGGYGNDWLEYLDWTGSVLNPTTSVSVTVNAMVNHDSEPDWDFLYFGYMANGNYTALETMTGPQEGLAFTTTFSISPSQYGGPGLDEVYLRWRFESDGNTSDADCLYPSQGGAQVDLIGVYFDQGSGPQLQGYVEDCEGVQPAQWFHTFSVGVGDFAKVWPLLTDIDPCKENTTPQVGFIDDGLVVPGTGGLESMARPMSLVSSGV